MSCYAQSLDKKMKAVKPCLGLSKLNFKDFSYHKPASHIILSTHIKVEISHLKAVKKSVIPRFCSLNLMWYYSSVLHAHLAEKSPIKYYLTRNVTCFIASLLEEAPGISGRKFSRLLETLFTTQQLSGKIVEQAKLEFTKFL